MSLENKCSLLMLYPEPTSRPLTLRKENANPSPSCQISNFRAKIERVSRSNKSIPNPLAVVQLTKQGWPDHKHKTSPDARPNWSFKEEIHDADRILFKNHKMIVSEWLRTDMLKRIHESHLGIEKSRQRLLSHSLNIIFPH